MTNDDAPATNETNGQGPVPADEAAAGHETSTPDAPRIQILTGRPTDAEVAALVAVLGSAVGGGGEPSPPVFSQWGLPVDKLRYSIHSWQRMSLQQRTHMRGK